MRVLSTEAKLASPASAHAGPRGPSPSAAGPGAGPGSFSQLLGRFGKELDRGEKTIAAAATGGAANDPGALLALQAGIYRYVEAVDLASKLVDHATSAVKTTLQSQ